MESTSTVEVLFEPREEIAQDGLQFDPARHEILPDGDWIRSARRHTRRPELFIYRHREFRTYVVAAWIFMPSEPCGSGGACTEISVMSAPPDSHPADLPTMEYMRIRVKPIEVQAERALSRLKMRKDKKKALRLSSLQQQKSVAKHYRRKGEELVARSIEFGPYVGKEEGGDMHDATVDDLSRRASGKVTVGGT